MKKLILLFAISWSSLTIAQSNEKRADIHFNEFEFTKAIEIYAKIAAKKRKPSLHVMRRLADSYFNTGAYAMASNWYSKMYAIEGRKLNESTIIKLVQCLKANGDLIQADDVLKEYYTNQQRLQTILALKMHLDSLSNQYTIQNVKFNSNKSDFAPSYYRDKLIFTSARDSVESEREIYAWNNQAYLDIYETYPEGENNASKKFLKNLESSFHDSNLIFSSDNRKVYFTRNYYKKDKLDTNDEGLSSMQILKGDIVDDKIENIVSLNFNSQAYSCGHPALSANGRYLYFTSNMPGGYGESDLYVVELNSQGEVFSPPVNLGFLINTAGREMFPFVEGDMLYFSSDSHYGYGGLDIFSSKIISKKSYEMPLNMGQPLNSNMDDFSYISRENGIKGYFASNRFGGLGDDDIYHFTRQSNTSEKEVMPMKAEDCLEYSGFVRNEKTGDPIAGASIEVYNYENEMITQQLTDAKGFYKIVIPCNNQNTIVFTKPRYSKKTVSVISKKNDQNLSSNNIIYLTPFDSLIEKEGSVEKIKVNPIYFDYDKSDITERAIIELDKVLFAMKEFPDIKIRIESHTDSRGNDIYNLNLSDKRAKATRRYLISKGIDIERIESANGYGEYRLKNDCDNTTNCSENDHLMNRRSDFIVISK